eukprot:jgi/Botrbrau1/2533/Bobra.0079s0021.1
MLQRQVFKAAASSSLNICPDRCRIVARVSAKVSSVPSHRGGRTLQNNAIRPCKRRIIAVVKATTNGSSLVQDEVWTDEAKERFENIKQRFRTADTDGNGVIDRNELKILLESLDGGNENILEQWLTDEDVDKVMAQYDTNRNGVIDFDEFIKLAQDGLLLEGKLAEYEAAFKSVDTSGNGVISATELTELMENLGHKMTYAKLTKIMADFDKDHTGSIEFWEFMRMFRKQLLDLQEILDYIKMNPTASDAAVAAPQEKAVFLPGELNIIYSSAELDELLNVKHTLVVVLASLTWCRPCKMLTKPLQAMAKHYPARFIKFYGNSNEDTKNMFKNRFKARVTPTFYFFRDGEVVHTHTGGNIAKLENFVRESLESGGDPVPPSLELGAKKTTTVPS